MPDEPQYVQQLGYCHQLDAYLMPSHFGTGGPFGVEKHEKIYTLERGLLSTVTNLPPAIKIDFKHDMIYVMSGHGSLFTWQTANHLTVEIYA